MLIVMCVFFFKQKTAYEMRISDWSSDVCSSDLDAGDGAQQNRLAGAGRPADHDGLARLDREVDAVEHHGAAEALLDADDGEIGHDLTPSRRRGTAPRPDSAGHRAPGPGWAARPSRWMRRSARPGCRTR